MAIGFDRHSRRLAGFVAAAAAALALMFGLPAFAQPAAWTDKGCAGCHGTPPSAGRVNAANAPALLQHVIANGGTNGTGMAGITFAGSELTDITNYLETVFDTTPMAASPAFQAGTTVSLAGKVLLNTGPTGLNVLENVSSPGKGSVSYNTGTPSFTYTAGACQTGNDTFTYRARNTGNGVTTSTRTVNVSIANPVSGPTFSSGTTANGQTGVPFTYNATVSTCPSLVTWNLDSAPAWLGINSSGVVSGTPPFGTQGTSPTFTVRATYPGGAFSTRVVTLTIALGVPTVTSAASAPNGAVGIVHPGYQITATNGPPFTAFAATGLPPGLSVNTGNGLISGTPTTQGNFVASVTASNAAGTSAPQNVSFNIAVGIPAITSPATASGAVTLPFSYQITATNSPTSFNASGLPSGVSINTTTGLISGTPTVDGVFNATVSATNATGTGNLGVTITITVGPPVITSPATANGAVTLPFSYQITATNSPASFNATGLPPGLAINTATGLISGTPIANGTFNSTVSATNATGTGNLAVTITIAVGPPVITSPNAAAGQTGVAFSYQIAATNGPTSFNATGLPPGLSVNTGNGLISGTPTATGASSVTISATNGTGTGTQGLTITITLGPPVITSALAASAGVAVPFTYQITATNSPTSFGATGLPPGLSLDSATGIISGSPTAPGNFPVTISATNAVPLTGNATLTINVATIAPIVNSPTTASGQTGFAFGYQITALNGPTSFAATGLPPGLAVNTTTGLISGTPTTVGQFIATLTAANGAGTSPPQATTFDITLGPPVITSPATASGAATQSLTYQITAINSPTSFNATGLPPGLAVNTANGLVSGTPTASGTFNATVSATNATGTGSLAVVFSIATGPPVITSPATASGAVTLPFSYQITATNSPTGFGATGLPPGLAVNTATGLISGTPTATGAYGVTVNATNATGTGTLGVTITIAVGPPVITSPPTAGGAATLPFTYQITATNSPTSFSAAGLPPGLSVNSATGLVSGTPAIDGSFTVTLGATNATGTGTLTLTILIAVGPPVINSPASASGATEKSFDYQITASGGPTSFSATGLPEGLSINTATGLISGTPSVPGTFTVTLSATNATGTGTLALTLTIGLSPPVINSPPTATATSGQPFNYQITGTGGPTTFNATGLPPGLTLNASTGLISGTPATGGTFSVTVSATNATGTATQVITITIAFVAPAVRDLSVEVAFQAPTPIALPVTGQFTQVTIVAAPAHGTLTSPAPGATTVTYTSATGYSGEDSFTYSATGPGGTSGVATVTITVPTFRPVVATASMVVQLNTPAQLDLTPFITGSGVTGVAIAGQARHGTVAVDGKSVTYTPKTDYFGTDSFQYFAFGNAGRSEPGTVNVTITGRPDPTKDATVVGLLEAQAKAARRFTRAQATNYQRRMESLHVGPAATARDSAEAPTPAARSVSAIPPAASAPAASTAGGNDGPSARSTAGSAPVAALASALVGMATTQSVNLASSTGSADGSSPGTQGTHVWIGGTATFGKRSLEEEGTDLRFSTDGVTVGADRRVSDRLALGMGIGYARDHTDVGRNGSKSKADGVSFAGYGSYQPTRDTFLDALFGFGTLDFETDRYVASHDEFATGRRKGRQVFGSLAAGYEFRRDGILLSPYGRIDLSVDRLERSTESGAGLAALSYHEQRLRSVQAAAGLRLETRHQTDFGMAMPRMRLEYRHDVEGGRAATLSYADGFEGRTYSVTPSGSTRNHLMLGVGADFLLRRGLRIGVDYQGERSFGPGTTQSVRFLVSQDLDGGAWPSWGWGWAPLADPVNVEAGLGFDDNVSRGRLSSEKLSDQVYSLGLNASRTFPINENTRAVATGLVSVDKFHDHTGLGRTSGGLQGEIQYRASGNFDSITYALFARAWIDGYESRLRSGSRLSAGINARRSLTDRIEVFGEAGANWRRAESAVFTGRDFAAKLNLDYSLGAAGTAYLAGEYRRGDAFASGFSSLANLNSAEVLVRDDAFDVAEWFAYRFEASTLLGTLGFNRPLGPRDSLDLSWRRVQTTPLTRPDSGPTSYTVNQYSILYLMRF